MMASSNENTFWHAAQKLERGGKNHIANL